MHRAEPSSEPTMPAVLTTAAAARNRAVQAEDSAELPARTFPPRSRAHHLLLLVRNRLSYALGDQVVYSLGNMVVAAVLSRGAGARIFGMYILTQRSMDILVQLCNTLSWAPFTFNLPGTPHTAQSRYRGSILLQQLIACVLCVPLLLLCTHWASTAARGVYYGTFRPMVFTAGILLFREFNRRMYFAELRMREAFWTEVAANGIQVLGVLYYRHTGRLDVTHTLYALAFGAGLLGIWWLLREARTLSFSLRALAADTALNFRLGRWLLGSNLVFIASNQANPWILSAVFGGGSVGAYAVCESIVNIPRVALVSLQNVFAPMLARAHAEGGRRLLRERVSHIDRRLTIGSILAALAIVALGPFVAHALFGKTMPSDARVVLFFLGLNFVAFAATLAQSYALSAIDRAGPTLLANVAGLAAQAVAAVLLVRRFQLPGAAAALFLGSGVVLLVRGVYYNRELVSSA